MFGHNGFPEIRHIDDLLPVVEGRQDFAVKRRDGYTAIDYIFAGPDTFDEPLRRECRGVKFDAAGGIIGRPFHKFFNVGEKPETQSDVLAWADGHVVLEKLDGSMIHPALVAGEVLWMTRAGVTNIADDAAAHAARFGYIDRARSLLMAGITPIFEWCSPRNQIVLRYPEDRLVLTGARAMRTGEYLPLDGLGFPHTVVTWGQSVGELAQFMAHVRDLKDAEGYVVRWHSGAMVKVKADDYVTKHKARDSILLEKNVLRIVLEGAVDDVVPLLAVEDAARLTAYSGQVRAAIHSHAGRLERLASDAKLNGLDRKAFALTVVNEQLAIWKGPLFSIWQGSTGAEAVTAALLKNCGSLTDVEGIRPLIGAEWNAPLAEAA